VPCFDDADEVQTSFSNITPLLKKGARSDAGNYRPVSLTSYLGKTLEAIIKDKIMYHLTTIF